ncbi:MAG: hypothetical protein ACLVEX_02450 [Ruthenibacterium lactatiformans]
MKSNSGAAAGGRWGFDGLIVSDCMEMQAIKDHFGTVNGVVAADGCRSGPGA